MGNTNRPTGEKPPYETRDIQPSIAYWSALVLFIMCAGTFVFIWYLIKYYEHGADKAAPAPLPVAIKKEGSFLRPPGAVLQVSPPLSMIAMREYNANLLKNYSMDNGKPVIPVALAIKQVAAAGLPVLLNDGTTATAANVPTYESFSEAQAVTEGRLSMDASGGTTVTADDFKIIVVSKISHDDHGHGHDAHGADAHSKDDHSKDAHAKDAHAIEANPAPHSTTPTTTATATNTTESAH